MEKCISVRSSSPGSKIAPQQKIYIYTTSQNNVVCVCVLNRIAVRIPSQITKSGKDKGKHKNINCKCHPKTAHGGARRGATAAATAAVGPGGEGGKGGGESPTDYTKPQQTIQSPNRLYKAPKHYTKPAKKHAKPNNIKQEPKIFNKSSNKYQFSITY